MEQNTLKLLSTLFALMIIICVIGLMLSGLLELIFIPALVIVVAGFIQKKNK
ncbi:MAG: hypothetical protein UDG94_09550 [Peptococcaceae bacterium]|nr:hypothetical protein [Peptococcaceae bacterium]